MKAKAFFGHYVHCGESDSKHSKTAASLMLKDGHLTSTSGSSTLEDAEGTGWKAGQNKLLTVSESTRSESDYAGALTFVSPHSKNPTKFLWLEISPIPMALTRNVCKFLKKL